MGATWRAPSHPCRRPRTSRGAPAPLSTFCPRTPTGRHGVAARRFWEEEPSSQFHPSQLRPACSYRASQHWDSAHCCCFCRPALNSSVGIARGLASSVRRRRPASAEWSGSRAGQPTSAPARSGRWSTSRPARAARAPSGSGGGRSTAPPPSVVQPPPRDPAGRRGCRSSCRASWAASSPRGVRSCAGRARPGSSFGYASGRCFDERAPLAWPAPCAPDTSSLRSHARSRSGCRRSSTPAPARVSSELRRGDHRDRPPALGETREANPSASSRFAHQIR